MKNTKKILSVILATLMMLSIFTIGFTASAEESKIIDRVDITLKTDIAGKTSADYEEIYTVNTKHVTYEGTNIDPDYSGLYTYFEDNDFYDKLVENNVYDLGFCLATTDGYTFAEDVAIYINGELATVTDKEFYDVESYMALFFKLENVTVTRPYDVFDLVSDLIKDIKNNTFDINVFFTNLAKVVTNFFNDTVKFFDGLFNDLFKPAPAE